MFRTHVIFDGPWITIYIHTYIHTYTLLDHSLKGAFQGQWKQIQKEQKYLLRIPAGGRLTSWLGGVEFGTTADKSIQWQGAGFEPVTSGLQVRRPTTRPHALTLI